MLTYSIDLINRCVILKAENGDGASPLADFVINEFDTLEKKFLSNTDEKYECELVLMDVKKTDETGEETGEVETRAFSRRKGFGEWIMPFNPEEYIID